MKTIDIAATAQQLENQTAHEVVRWVLETFHPKVALASSFGAEDVVLIDMMVKVNPKARVFTLDTGRLPYETYEVMDAIREKYKISIEVMFPDTQAVETMVRERGLNLFYHSIENRKMCCGVRKVEPLKRALKGLDAWITGLRRDQGVTRTQVQKVERDLDHGNIIKVNPLADWTWDQVWAYIRANHIPYNKLHDQHYPSIGCAPCTRAVKHGEDPRAGRWWWEAPEQKECGLHVHQPPPKP
ncbi:MAG: phosphoadenylyl-sulfate reductase [Elusimicrobia bacterium]|nr:phosphoadenylyl-sulfate reductase [Elusimicrobiota bacterium]